MGSKGADKIISRRDIMLVVRNDVYEEAPRRGATWFEMSLVSTQSFFLGQLISTADGVDDNTYLFVEVLLQKSFQAKLANQDINSQ